MIYYNFWNITCIIFTIMFSINYICLKRWKEQYVFERIIFIFNFYIITLVYFKLAMVRYDSYDSITEDTIHTFVHILNEDEKFYGTLYCILLLVVSIILLINIIYKTKYNNKLFYISISTFITFFSIIWIYLSKINPSKMYMEDYAYIFLVLLLFVLISYLLYDMKSNKLIYTFISFIIPVLLLIILYIYMSEDINLAICYVICATILPIFKIIKSMKEKYIKQKN